MGSAAAYFGSSLPPDVDLEPEMASLTSCAAFFLVALAAPKSRSLWHGANTRSLLQPTVRWPRIACRKMVPLVRFHAFVDQADSCSLSRAITSGNAPMP